MASNRSDLPTIVDLLSLACPSLDDPYEEGWLTDDAYLSWVLAEAEVYASDKPLTQPPPPMVEDEGTPRIL